jgi:hypothetical protein
MSLFPALPRNLSTALKQIWEHLSRVQRYHSLHYKSGLTFELHQPAELLGQQIVVRLPLGARKAFRSMRSSQERPDDLEGHMSQVIEGPSGEIKFFCAHHLVSKKLLLLVGATHA